MTPPKDPLKREEYLRKNKERSQKLASDPIWRCKHKDGCKKRFENPEYRQKNKEMLQQRAQDPEYQRKHKEAMIKLHQDPEYQRKHKEAMQLLTQDPAWIRKNKEAIQLLTQDPAWIRKNKEMLQQRAQDPEYRQRNKEMLQQRAQDPVWLRENKEKLQKLAQDPEYKRKHKESVRKLTQDPIWQYNHTKAMRRLAKDPEYLLKLQEGLVGGFCIQNITYNERIHYCELWCPDLWHRIDEAQNYQSILSGKTKEDNIGKNGKTRALSRHHVYWQPRACCVWDEDAGGYYAWIETGTKKHPNKVKYYIRGDPNKFVLLTMSEHKMISKDKLKWIEIFENLIETKLGGVCYSPST